MNNVFSQQIWKTMVTWYFVTKIVLTYSEKKSLEQFVQIVKGQNNGW